MNRTIEVPQYLLHEEVRIDPARTALVVVDMQNDFAREGGSLRLRSRGRVRRGILAAAASQRR